MAKRLISCLIFNNKSIKLNSSLPVFHKKLHTQVPTKEIQIPVKYGHISAKLWGSSDRRPILALHGWQDNAGTWDPLAPMLTQDRSILAIDFPGHGLSSWIPAGMMYYQWELPRLIYFIKQYFKWDKVSLLTHSMGAIAAMRYSCLFPDDVDFYIAVDSLIHDDYDLDRVIDNYPKIMEKAALAQTRLDIEPPAYTLEEIQKIWCLGTKKSVAFESVPYLMERGTKQSKVDPTKYYFSRDSRLKFILFNPENRDFVEALVRRQRSPTLYIKAIDSPYSTCQYSVDMREIVEKNNEKFEMHFVPGTHHVHLNSPELLAPLILNFLNKYKM